MGWLASQADMLAEDWVFAEQGGVTWEARNFYYLVNRKQLNTLTEKKEKTDIIPEMKAEDVYVVWYSKTLQNHKALLSTPVSDGMYYEITYNGDRNELYFDAYKKWENICIKL